MPPFALDPAMRMRTITAGLRIAPHHTTGTLNMHRDPVALQFHVDPADRPRLAQPMPPTSCLSAFDHTEINEEPERRTAIV